MSAHRSKKKSPFSQALADWIWQDRLTAGEAAIILAKKLEIDVIPVGTFRGWLYERYEPSELLKREILKAIKPSTHRRK